ncbi:MAG TPA: alanine racemase [Chloroflexota bacterium]
MPCWLEVDLDRIAANVRSLKQWVGPHTKIAAVVKSGAYGVGAEEVARVALTAGAEWLAVARVHEAVELRQAGIEAPILVLSRTHPLEADLAAQHRLAVTVESPELACALSMAASTTGRPVAVHLKVDTGMHRFGVLPSEARALAEVLATTPGLRVEGLWTHFASADEPDLSSARDQLQCFFQVRQQLHEAGLDFPVCHTANSAATLAFPDAHLDLVRPGLTLYGISPLVEDRAGPDLLPALALKARLARVMTVQTGESVGYGRTWRAPRPSRVGLIAAGYADGLPRLLSNRGAVLVLGRPAGLIGRVSMDHTTIDITDIPQADVGSVVTVFGEDGDTSLDIAELAQHAGTIPHDILTGVGGRVARVYRQGGTVVRVARLNAESEPAL